MKKFVIFNVCLVTICIVLGLSDNLNYNGFKVAAENIQGSIDVIIDDISSISVFKDFADNRDNIAGVIQNEKVITVWYFDHTSKSYQFATQKTSDNYYRLLHDINNKRFVEDASLIPEVEKLYLFLESISYYIKLIFIFISFIITTIFDTFGIVFSVIQSGLYLIGIGRL